MLLCNNINLLNFVKQLAGKINNALGDSLQKQYAI